MDLWPEDNDPKAVIAAADKLNVSVVLESTCEAFPSAWPWLRHVPKNTSEYVQMMFDAQRERQHRYEHPAPKRQST